MIGHIAARELRSLFLSPLAWAILAVVQIILALLFRAQVVAYMQLQPQLSMMQSPVGVTVVVVAQLFGTAAIVMMLVMPLLTMRLLSEERRSNTLHLLFSAPVSLSEVILGKYLGILGFIGIMITFMALMTGSLALGGHLDWGHLAAALLGMVLVLAAFAAAGTYLSTLTAQPAVAAISTFGLLLLLWVIDFISNDSDGTNQLLPYLSLQRHYQAFLQGVFDTSDVVYFVLFILVFLTLSIRRLDADRLQH